jgi:hypothetical protein
MYKLKAEVKAGIVTTNVNTDAIGYKLTIKNSRWFYQYGAGIKGLRRLVKATTICKPSQVDICRRNNKLINNRRLARIPNAIIVQIVIYMAAYRVLCPAVKSQKQKPDSNKPTYVHILC